MILFPLTRMRLWKVYWDARKDETLNQRSRELEREPISNSPVSSSFFGGNMQDLVNRLQSARDLTQQLLVRL
jgi:hypothetical protein